MIIGVSGKKGSGKNTVANILHGIVLKNKGLVKDWTLGSSGELIVNTDNSNGVNGWGELSIYRKDPEYISYAEHNMWPYVKIYSFADSLKWICTHLFEIPHECVWGTDDQKNQVQKHLLWENMPGTIDPDLHKACMKNHYGQGIKEFALEHTQKGTGPMTAREFMQFFGTDIMRKIWSPVWIRSCISRILSEGSELAVICDVRFPDEASAIEAAGGFVIRLTRNVKQDEHVSETALDTYSFKHVIDNHDCSLDSFMEQVTKMYRKLS